MSIGRSDQSLQDVLKWALERMKTSGYSLRSKVAIVSDPDLKIMGYAKEKDGIHYVVVADWALDSEMLGGLVLHELSHIHAAEKGAPTHSHEIIDEILSDLKQREGLTDKEAGYLIDAFDHLQNITVDDIVFQAMEKREMDMTKDFFAGWVSEHQSGSPALDAALLARNAFAIASLKRHGMYEPGSEMARRNDAFLSSLGDYALQGFSWIEAFLETARGDWTPREFRIRLEEYLERMVSLMRDTPQLRDLR